MIREKEIAWLSDKDRARKRIRNQWYRRWLRIAKQLRTGKISNREIMLLIWEQIDRYGGFGYSWISDSSRQDLHLVFEDCLNNDCNKCKQRFKCFTERNQA